MKQGDLHVVVLLYVNDMIITGNNDNEVASLQEELSIRFDIKKLEELHHFLGLEITNTSKGIFVTQERYAKKLVDRSQAFRALVGSLLYLTITRTGIAFSVGYVILFMQSPRKPHLEAAKRILKYINSTSELGLFFQRKNNLVLIGYTDADFGGDMDNRRSTSGYIFLCDGTSVS
ncbi:secreted RxLR effector protein 161-like [Solanum dulcamara]|uniref:secreted RxLR effector protein 161-like n=1 Tax=Solanum dulcamara TaxID=45834 RepID=UPI002485A965|nr:secreted RxLR effector protein 161-like [Solanum dulcamara]